MSSRLAARAAARSWSRSSSCRRSSTVCCSRWLIFWLRSSMSAGAASPDSRQACSPSASDRPCSNCRIRQLEQRLSDALGEQAWRESGLAAPADIDDLNQKINHLEQQTVELRLQLDERDQDLAAARAANRELIAQLNTPARHR